MQLLKYTDFLLEYNYKNNISNEYIKGSGEIENPWKMYDGEIEYDEEIVGDSNFADEAEYYRKKRLENELKA